MKRWNVHPTCILKGVYMQSCHGKKLQVFSVILKGRQMHAFAVLKFLSPCHAPVFVIYIPLNSLAFMFSSPYYLYL